MKPSGMKGPGSYWRVGSPGGVRVFNETSFGLCFLLGYNGWAGGLQRFRCLPGVPGPWLAALRLASSSA